LNIHSKGQFGNMRHGTLLGCVANFTLGRYLWTFALLLPALTQGMLNYGNSSFTTVGVVPVTSGLENLAVRRNGEILVTSTTSNVLHQLSSAESAAPIDVVEISGLSALLGIAELEDDVFYVAGSNLSGVSASGTNEIWKVDMRSFHADRHGRVFQPADLSLVIRLPSAQLLNGVCSLAWNDTEHLLVSDSGAGTIIRVNVHTGSYEVVLQDSKLSPRTSGLGIGVNGIETYGDRLFFVNLDQQLFASVQISLSTGRALGPVQMIASIPEGGDDFALARDGKTALIALNGQFAIHEIDIASRTSRNISDTLFERITSLAHKRNSGHWGSEPLYITGAMTVNDTRTVGRVLRADPSAFH
jgi:hypothetical protein